MGSEPDLHRAISLRPSPFHRYPDPPPNDSFPALSTDKAGASSGVEPSTPPGDDNNPVSRHNWAVSAEEAETQRLPQYTQENDPFQLSSKIKSSDEIEQIKANTSRKRGTGCTPNPTNTQAWRARQLKGFYEDQNENIERLLKPVDEHVREAKQEQGEDQLKFKIAVRGSFAANVLLAILQVYGAVSSGSLSLFTTMADALFDPLSNVTLILSNRAVNSVDPRNFPSGKARIETAGNIVFCFLMFAVSAVLIVTSARDLAAGSTDATRSFHLPSVIAVAIAFCTKVVLFVYCWALRNKYSQIRILWEDHRNDLLINGFGILTSVGGSKLKWWIDPMGAIILSCLISFLWLRTAYSEFQLLIGVTADPHTLQLITYICE